ncbi:MAG: hypothetical protein INR64_04170 [Caulobacteraceae bacterium]|nr:hypothetical protein [Caulobacter sp.]
MSEAAPAPPAARRGGLTPWLVGGAVAAFGLFLLALAFPPDLAPVDAGAHALSRSPVGYAGLVRLLNAAGAPTRVSRAADPPLAGDPLLVLTPLPSTPVAEVLQLTRGRRALVVPPKWIAADDPKRPGRLLRLGPLDPHLELRLAQGLLARGSLGGAPSALVTTRRMAPAMAPGPVGEAAPRTAQLGMVEALRTFTGAGLQPVVVDDRGQTLLARVPDRPVYVLSDADLLDNHGMADLRTARAAVALVGDLAAGAPVVWDVTLDGIAAKAPTKNPLKAMFLPPFLPATLCLFLVGALTALAGRERFGAVEDAGRAYAFGKRALADSTASLISLAGREPRFAPRYAELARAEAIAAAGLAPLGRDAQDAALDRLGERRGVGGWSRVRDAAQGVASVRGLMASARRTWTWRRGMTRGRG